MKRTRPRRLDRPHAFSVRNVAYAQAIYYVPTGIWPLLHMRSFEWVTGPKVDRWLVKTVAGLLTVVGAVLGLSASSQRVTPELRILAVGTSVSLAMVDIVYVRRKRIRRIYALDALANICLAIAMIVSSSQSPDADRSTTR
jgi:VanZ family protein